MSLSLVNGKLTFLRASSGVTTYPQYSSTDDFVEKTDVVFHGTTDQLFTVGHPYYGIGPNNSIVPKVSAYQYRVFKLKLPDPNLLPLVTTDFFDPETERLAYQLVGLEIHRDGPLGIGASGNLGYNKWKDAENPALVLAENRPVEGDLTNNDHRVVQCFDGKQQQLLIVGCLPALGQFWDKAVACAEDLIKEDQCPPIETKTTVIEDGDMTDMGFGNLNFKALAEDYGSLPLELVGEIAKYPDFTRMAFEGNGNHCFFCLKREQMYGRHFILRAGAFPEKVESSVDISAVPNYSDTAAFSTLPSGSLVSSDTQMFNKPYWLTRAQGPNNGMLWGDCCYVTLADTTRNTVFNISQLKKDGDISITYDESKINQFLRHVEEFKLSIIVRLCKIKLRGPILYYLYSTIPQVLAKWGIGDEPPQQSSVADVYRYIQSKATKCPLQPNENDEAAKAAAELDPYGSFKFWEVDLSKTFTRDLQFTPLGRKFLGYVPSGNSSKTVNSAAAKKRKRG